MNLVGGSSTPQPTPFARASLSRKNQLQENQDYGRGRIYTRRDQKRMNRPPSGTAKMTKIRKPRTRFGITLHAMLSRCLAAYAMPVVQRAWSNTVIGPTIVSAK